MPRNRKIEPKKHKRPIDQYDHKGKKRTNNPQVGLVTPDTDPPEPAHRTYDYIEPVPSIRHGQELDYDPHLDPQLVWAGKKEHTSFEVPSIETLAKYAQALDIPLYQIFYDGEAEPKKIKGLNLDGEKLSLGERREIESLGRKFAKLKERDKGLVRLLVAKLAQATS